MKKLLLLLFFTTIISCNNEKHESKQRELEDNVQELNDRVEELENKINDLDKSKATENNSSYRNQEPIELEVPENVKKYKYEVILTQQYQFEKIEPSHEVSITTGLVPDPVELPTYIPHLKFVHYVSNVYECDENSKSAPLERSNFEFDIEMKISSLNSNNSRYNTIPGMEKNNSSIVSKKEYVFDTYEEAILKRKEANAND